MADPSNSVGAVGARIPGTPGDVPERLARRYFTEARAREHRFYLDAQVKTPVFVDRGRRLIAPRSDPNAVRDMVAIAQHRGWSLVEVRGTPGFRREAWLAGRTLDLEVRGYQPTQRDLQELDRRREGHTRLDARLKELERGVAAGGSHRGAAERLKVVEAVVKSRIAEPATQDRVLHRARERVAELLERGERFDVPQRPPARDLKLKERHHTR